MPKPLIGFTKASRVEFEIMARTAKPTKVAVKTSKPYWGNP
jgi:hypothetical protein